MPNTNDNDPTHSLRTVAAANAPVLIIDASPGTVRIGLVETGGGVSWASGDREAIRDLFPLISGQLACASCKPDDIGALVFCEGPGSELGVRIVAAFLRIWRLPPAAKLPVWSYRSLELAATALRMDTPGEELLVAIDGRRGSWWTARLTPGGKLPVLERLPTDRLESLPGKRMTLLEFRRWSPLPDRFDVRPYDLGAYWQTCVDIPLLRSVDNPAPLNTGPRRYVKWTPARHRAPASS